MEEFLFLLQTDLSRSMLARNYLMRYIFGKSNGSSEYYKFWDYKLKHLKYA